MKITLFKTELFNEPVKSYLIDDKDNPVITEVISTTGEKYNLDNEEHLNEIINFLNDCYVEPVAQELCTAFFGSMFNTEELFKGANERLDNIVKQLTNSLEVLKSNQGCNYNDASLKDNKCLDIARRYMDEVIDPSGKMPNSEYNKLLSMFTMYNHWVMNR